VELYRRTVGALSRSRRGAGAGPDWRRCRWSTPPGRGLGIPVKNQVWNPAQVNERLSV